MHTLMYVYVYDKYSSSDPLVVGTPRLPSGPRVFASMMHGGYVNIRSHLEVQTINFICILLVLLSLVMPLRFRPRWCLEDQVLPLVPKTLDLVDINRVGIDDRDNCNWFILNLKATANVEWLMKNLKLHSRWWMLNSKRVPLINEILEVINNINKNRKTAVHARLVVPIKIRNHVIFVLKDARAVKLAIDSDEPNFEDLDWFVHELGEDIGKLPAKGSSSATKPLHDEDPLVSEIIDNVVQDLKQHHACKTVCFVRSRRAFKVVKKNLKRPMHFHVPLFNKKRRQIVDRQDPQSVEQLRDAVTEVSSQVLQFLAGNPGSVPDCPVEPLEDDQQEENHEPSESDTEDRD